MLYLTRSFRVQFRMPRLLPLAPCAAFLLAALALLPTAASAAGILSIDNQQAAPGDTLNVNVLMDAGVQGLASVQFVIDFSRSSPPDASGGLRGIPATSGASPSEVTVIPGPAVPRNALVTASQRSGTQVAVGVVGVSGFSGPGVLVTVPLQVPTTVRPGTVYQLVLTNVLAYDGRGAAVSVATRPGTLTIASVLVGDVNFDNVVDLRDAMLALRLALGIISGTPEQLSAADVDGSGTVTVLDAQLILRTALGLPPIGGQPTDDRRAIETAYQRLAQAIRSADLNAVMALVSTDYIQDGVDYQGFRGVFADYFSTHSNVQASFQVTDVSFEVIDGTDVAFVTFSSSISGVRLGDLVVDREDNTDAQMVWIKQGGQWLMFGNQQTQPQSQAQSLSPGRIGDVLGRPMSDQERHAFRIPKL